MEFRKIVNFIVRLVNSMEPTIGVELMHVTELMEALREN